MHRFSQLSLLLFLLTLLLAGGGCTALHDAEELAARAMAENRLLEQENMRLQDELERQSALAARLQMELVGTQEKISRLGQNEGLAKEIAANTIRTPAASTRVETVAYIAEVTTEVEAIREKGEGEDISRLAGADELLVRANIELEAERYEEGSLLAAQALALVSRQDVEVTAKPQEPVGVYADFLSPLSLKATMTSNVRSGPWRSAKVLAVVAPETRVTAVGHQGSWVKINLENGKTGWIFYTLLAIPRQLQLPGASPGK